MKKGTCFLLFGLLATNILFSQGKVKVFNTVLKVKDIGGTANLTQQKWNRELPQVLLRNEDFYLKNIGSYRNSYMEDEPHSLFNLIDKGAYPLLDEINMTYYDEVVIPNLQGDKDVKNREDFIKFCEAWNSLTNYADRKALIFKGEFIDIGKLIQSKRFTFTESSFQISKDVTKKLSATITADIKADLKANNIEVTSSLMNYLSKTVTAQTKYSGIMIVVEFDDDYMSRLSLFLNGLDSKKTGTDNFSKALRDYAAPNSQRAATTGLIVFKLKGEINKSKLSEASLKADIKANFSSLDDDKVADIAAAISFGFVSKVENTFNAEIDNVYVKNYLTSEKIDQIVLAKLFNSLNPDLKKA
ncbi:hypothetical protein [Flavobacterium sp. TBRC 19031]|uniref:hypothetical protein n=1 Tax=Flavobacterium mekongense TaxID=3379707 RepID=UPI00399AC38F